MNVENRRFEDSGISNTSISCDGLCSSPLLRSQLIHTESLSWEINIRVIISALSRPVIK